MKDTFLIDAVSRSDTGKGASRRLRHEGLVPGIIYGGGEDPVMISTKHNELNHHLEQEAFYSHILKVNVEGTTQKVVLKDLQRHPAKQLILHFDLLRVSGKDVIKMHVPIHFVGEDVCPGAKEGGNILHTMVDVEVICTANDLPEYIEVDVSEVELGGMLHLTDIKMPEGVEILALTTHDDSYNPAVVSVQVPRGGSDDDEDGDEDTTPDEESSAEGETETE